MVFQWSLSDNKSSQVSMALLSILVDFNYAILWMVSTCPLISESSTPFINPSVTVPRVPITNGIIVTFIFHNFFYSLARSRYLFSFSLSFNFTLSSVGTAKAYSSFEGVSTDHRIVTAKVRLSLRKNATRKATTKHYDWALLNNRDIRDKYALELRNRFGALQEKTEKGTPNDEYENFVEAHLEAASKCILTKPRTKYRVPWETLAVREKRALVKTASKRYRKNPTNANARKLEKAQYQLAGIYLKEQAEYIQNQIDKIRDSVEDRQSRMA